MSQSTALILGANGRLGSALVDAFTARGWRVLAQARRAGVSTAPNSIIADMRGVDRVVRLARNAGSWFDQAIAGDVPKGKLTYPGPLDRVHAWAYVPDLAATFVRVAEVRQTLAQFENIHFSGYAITGGELVQSVEQATQRKMKVGGLPWLLMRLGGVVMPMWRELAEMSYLWQRPHRLITSTVHGHLLAPTTQLIIALRASLGALHPRLAEAGGVSLKRWARQRHSRIVIVRTP